MIILREHIICTQIQYPIFFFFNYSLFPIIQKQIQQSSHSKKPQPPPPPSNTTVPTSAVVGSTSSTLPPNPSPPPALPPRRKMAASPSLWEISPSTSTRRRCEMPSRIAARLPRCDLRRIVRRASLRGLDMWSLWRVKVPIRRWSWQGRMLWIGR